jgi:hypothetical protein
VAVKAFAVELNPQWVLRGLQFVSGKTISGIPLPGGGFNWSFGRNLGLGLQVSETYCAQNGLMLKGRTCGS